MNAAALADNLKHEATMHSGEARLAFEVAEQMARRFICEQERLVDGYTAPVPTEIIRRNILGTIV